MSQPKSTSELAGAGAGLDEGGDLGHLSVLDPQHVEAEGPILGVARALEVGRDRRLQVDAEGHELPAADVLRRAGSRALFHGPRDRLTPVVPTRRRGHRRASVLAQQRRQGRAVGALEGVHEASEHHALVLARIGRPRPLRPALRQVLAQRRPRALQGAVRRCDARLEEGGGLLCRPAEHVAQDQCRPLPAAAAAGSRTGRRSRSSPSPRSPLPARRPAARSPRAGDPGRAVATGGRPGAAPAEGGWPGARAARAAGAAACAGARRGTRWWRSGTARPGTSSALRSSRATARRAGRSPGPGPPSPRTSRASGSSGAAAPGGGARRARRTPTRRRSVVISVVLMVRACVTALAILQLRRLDAAQVIAWPPPIGGRSSLLTSATKPGRPRAPGR